MLATLVKDGKTRFEVECPSFAASSTYSPQILWMEMLGPQNACRALWANLVKGRKERRSVSTEVQVQHGKTHVVHVYPGEKLHSLVLVANKKKQGVLVFDSRLVRFNAEYILGGDELSPSPWFYSAFAKRIDIPILPTWTEILWREGIDDGLIKRPELVWGVNMWHMIYDELKWSKVVANLVKGGKLNG